MSVERRVFDLKLSTPLEEYHCEPLKDSPELAKRIEQRIENPEMTEDDFVLFVKDMVQYTGGSARKEGKGIRFWSKFITANGDDIELMSQEDDTICTQFHYFENGDAVIEDVYTVYDNHANSPEIERTFDLSTQTVPEFQSITGEMIGSRQKIGLQPLDVKYLPVIATNIYNTYRQSREQTSQENS